jgi:hypothetical protein
MSSVLRRWKCRGKMKGESVQGNFHRVHEPTRPELDEDEEEDEG